MFSEKHVAKRIIESAAVLEILKLGRYKYFQYGNPSAVLKGYIYDTEVRSVDGFTYITFKFSEGKHLELKDYVFSKHVFGLNDFTFCLDTPSRFELGENSIRIWGMAFEQQGKISKKPAFELILSETLK